MSGPVKLGVIFPQTEIGTAPIVIRDYAQAAESLGYDYLLAFDHVLGANPASRTGWRGAYRHTDSFHEPFVLFGYLAGLTKTIGLATGIIIFPSASDRPRRQAGRGGGRPERRAAAHRYRDRLEHGRV